VKYCLINWFSLFEVFNNDSLQERRCNLGIPDAFRVYDDDRSVAAHAEAWCLASLHPSRAEEQIFSLQELREQRIQLAAAAVGRAEISGAHKHMPRIRIHLRLLPVAHHAKIHRAFSSTCTDLDSV
jgi:hypothetical protein